MLFFQRDMYRNKHINTEMGITTEKQMKRQQLNKYKQVFTGRNYRCE